MSILGLFGIGNKNSGTTMDTIPTKPSSDEKTAMSEFNRHYGELQTRLSAYRTYTSQSRDPSGQLNAQTKQILKDAVNADLMGAIMESLGNLSVLHTTFEEDEKFVNGGQGPHLKKFDARKDETQKKINMIYGISQLATNVLNSSTKNSIVTLYNNARRTSRNAIDEEIVIKVLTAYVQTAESAQHLFNDICKRRETAKAAMTVKKGSTAFTKN